MSEKKNREGEKRKKDEGLRGEEDRDALVARPAGVVGLHVVPADARLIEEGEAGLQLRDLPRQKKSVICAEDWQTWTPAMARVRTFRATRALF